jgi:tetratricopeptide (TPR) repeat protein
MTGRTSQRFEQRKTAYTCSFLALTTFLLYWRTVGFEFIVVDDHKYVYQNSLVLKGLTWESIKWAFTSLHASNWHPLTWMSHMADVSIYGLFAGGHHLTNAFFHIANTVLLFLVLKQMTRSFWPSAFVAALFAWHPAHVESVAWVCERKDLLSTFFMVLTLWAYGRYTAQPSPAKYAGTLVLFAMGLMSKPMLVTLPCVLLLLDYWPLNRLPFSPGKPQENQTRIGWRKLLLEKIPFFALSAATCVITVTAQRGAMLTLERDPFSARFVNAITAYGRYLEEAVCPIHLSVFYPLPQTKPWELFAASAALLVLCSYLIYRQHLRAPWLIVGWLWFLGTLVPVIDLVQVGTQSMADRYTYIPYLGLFIMLAWSANDWLRRHPVLKPALAGAAIVSLSACLALSWVQLGYWHDSIRLFSHALEVTPSNIFSESNLSYALSEAGRGKEAIPHYQALLKLKPNDLKVRYNLGLELVSAGRPAEAADQFSEALRRSPDSDKLHNSLGIALAQQGKFEVAGTEFERAIQLNPNFPWPRLNNGVILQQMGNAGGAYSNYTKAVDLQPDWGQALDDLAFLLATCPEAEWRNPAKAVSLSTKANDLVERKSPHFLRTLAIAYAADGQFTNAVPTAELALRRARLGKFESLAAGLEQDLNNFRAGKTAAIDWKMAPESINIRR